MSEACRPSLPWISCEEKPSESVGHEERGQPAVALLGVGLGEDQRELGHVAERDPLLLAADAPAAVDLLGAGLEVGGVGAGVGLGQPEAAQRLARADAGDAAPSSAPRCPNLAIAEPTSEVFTDTTVRAEESARPISSTIRP